MAGRMQFDFTFSRPRTDRHRPDDEAPFRIVVLGDFSGDQGDKQRGARPIAARSILSIDVDNFDQVLSRVKPAVRWPHGAHSSEQLVEFSSLDDFHPDRLYQELGFFRGLKEMRARLLDPVTFPQAAAELRPSGAAQPGILESGASTGAPRENDDSVLERLLGSRPTPPVAAQVKTSLPPAVEQLIRRAVAPHIVPDAPPFQEQYVGSVDTAASELMRSLLHDRGFQALEAAWRGIRQLVSALELGEQVSLHLLDVSRADLQADVAAAGGDPECTQLYRRLVEDTARGVDASQWSLIVGQYTFARTVEDAQLLGVLGAIASQAHAPFLAAADASLAGCRSLLETPDPKQWAMADDEASQSWQSLRTSAVAQWIGLALPRLLLRLPYGERTERIDSFPFEEFADGGDHEAYLWGHPTIAWALLLGQSFLESGWSMSPGDRLDVGDLPAHIVERDGEKHMHACAEVYLSERAGEALLEQGLMPLMSFRNRNCVRLLRMQSLARPLQALAGRWA